MTASLTRLSTALLCPLLFACPQEGGTLTPPPAETKQAVAPAQAGSQPAENPHGDAFAEKGPPGKPISGLIKLGDGVKPEDVKPTDVLFVMARESQGGGKFGRLVAVQRFGQVEYPKRYELSSKDVMVPGIPFQGPFIVMARLDRDGDPMTKKPEDLYAVFTGEVMSGQEGVHLVLNKSQVSEVSPPPEAAAPPAKGQPKKMMKQTATSQPATNMKVAPVKPKMQMKMKLQPKQPASAPQ